MSNTNPHKKWALVLGSVSLCKNAVVSHQRGNVYIWIVVGSIILRRGWVPFTGLSHVRTWIYNAICRGPFVFNSLMWKFFRFLLYLWNCWPSLYDFLFQLYYEMYNVIYQQEEIIEISKNYITCKSHWTSYILRFLSYIVHFTIHIGHCTFYDSYHTSCILLFLSYIVHFTIPIIHRTFYYSYHT